MGLNFYDGGATASQWPSGSHSGTAFANGGAHFVKGCYVRFGYSSMVKLSKIRLLVT
jgi:hypothetical protein